MKLAFSNSTCPELDLDTLIAKSKAWGYQGFELLVDPHGQSDLGVAGALRSDPAGVHGKLADADQQIVALNAGVFVTPADPATDNTKDRVRQTIQLAAEIGCPLVVTTGAPLAVGADKLRLLERNTAALLELASNTASHGVTLALENAGVLALSQDIWHVRDAVGSPALRVCLNPLNARVAGDSLSVALKRLGAALALIHLADAELDPGGRVRHYVEAGRGTADLPHILELLKGLAYRGWLCLTWPASARLAGVSAELLLKKSARFLRAELDKPVVELTAYKGAKNAPGFVSPGPSQPPFETP